jgi:hypothetical protein
MTTNEALAAGTPDYGNIYAPIDAARYQNHEAQLYFEQVRARQYQQARRVGDFNKRQSTAVLTGGHSFREMTKHARNAPTEQDYATYNRLGNAYTQDMTDRIFDSAEAVGGGLSLGMDFTAAIVGDRMGSSWAKSRGMGRIARFGVGMGTGLAASLGVTAAVAGAAKFVGLGQAFEQFGEIDNLREMSPMMTSGTSGNPHTGRMSREDAQTIASYLHKADRYSMLQRDGKKLGDLQNEVGVLAEHQLLEGVRNTEDFVRKFRRLKESLQKMTEMFGKSFEEGAVMLQEFRNMGVDPTSAFHAIKKGYDVAAQHGLDPEQAHAAGMRGALSVQGTGLSMEAGYMSGISAEGSARTIYENGLIGGRTMFNLGGPQNLGMSIQRGQMRYLQSQAHTANLMSAIGRDGVDFEMIAGTASGARSLEDNVQGVSRNIRSIEDLMRYRAAQSEVTSQIQERHPGAVSAMAVNQVMTMVRDQLGQDPTQISKSELSQYAPMLIPGMSSDEFKVLMADVEAQAMTAGREQLLNRDVEEGRFRDQVRMGAQDRGRQNFRSGALAVGIVHRGAEMEQDVRKGIFEANRSVNDWIAQTVYGQTNLHISGEAASAAQRVREMLGDPTMGTRYEDAWYRSGDPADILKLMLDEGAIEVSEIVKPVSSARLRGKMGSDTFTESDLKRLGLDESMEGVSRGPSIGGEDKFLVGRDVLSDKGWSHIDGRGYVRQADLNKAFDQSRGIADAITEANANFDLSSLSGEALNQAIDVQGDFLARMTKGNRGQKISGRIEGKGRFELVQEITETAAEAMGIDTSTEGWRDTFQDRAKTPEGQRVLGAIYDMGRQIPQMADAMAQAERFISVDPSGAFSLDRAEGLMEDIEGSYKKLSRWGGKWNPLSGTENVQTQEAFDQILGQVDGAQNFTLLASNYLLTDDENERDRIKKQMVDAGFGSYGMIALRALEEEDTDHMRSLKEMITTDGAKAAVITAMASEGAEGTTGSQTISGRGTRLQQGQAYRQEQEMINRSLQETYDMLSALSNSVESLHNKISGGSATQGPGSGKVYGIVGGAQSLLKSIF